MQRVYSFYCQKARTQRGGNVPFRSHGHFSTTQSGLVRSRCRGRHGGALVCTYQSVPQYGPRLVRLVSDRHRFSVHSPSVFRVLETFYNTLQKTCSRGELSPNSTLGATFPIRTQGRLSPRRRKGAEFARKWSSGENIGPDGAHVGGPRPHLWHP